MSLTKFGATIREYRRDLNLTLSVMAAALKTSPAFLSAMETGRSKVPMDWVEKIADYLRAQQAQVDKDELKALACVSNESVSLEGLPPQHKTLIAGFANSDFTQEQLNRLGNLLAEIYAERPKDDA
ncbi:MAG: helix-turn-helix domain-containing protein [Gammaproteobacteria bacterium]|nr:helix-turn-helix domain-containing protein [Gammaproteobacteria bacterium]MBU1803587.1 helix-turn-helix domain-containing protein [Gammaproteobacteria bacterium]